MFSVLFSSNSDQVKSFKLLRGAFAASHQGWVPAPPQLNVSLHFSSWGGSQEPFTCLAEISAAPTEQQVPARCPPSLEQQGWATGLHHSQLLEAPVLLPWTFPWESREAAGTAAVYKKKQGLTWFSVRADGLG